MGADTKLMTAMSRFVFIVISFLSMPANGQQQVIPNVVILEEEDEIIPRYAVELIIFEYVGTAADTSEIFEPDIPEVSLSQDDFTDEISPETASDGLLPEAITVDLEVAADAVVIVPAYRMEELEEIPTFEQAGFIWLENESYQLTNIYSRLTQLAAYRPVMHTAWIQPTLEKGETAPLKLRRIGAPPLRLNGTVSLYLSRFLHLALDLTLEHKNPYRMTGTREQLSANRDNRSQAELVFEMGLIQPSIYYRIQEDRIIRNNELRYFDHPKFGVLVQITLVEENVPDEINRIDNILPNIGN